jgi:tripartite-type tricarboxylate transporter receptor subunit TctC
VPKETPTEIVEILQKTLEETAKDEEFIQDLENQGIDTLFLNQEAYKSYLDTLNENTAKIADQLQ